MVDINSVFPSKYLKAADLEDKPHLCTMTDVTFEEMRDGESKLCVHFKEWEKGLLLNKTNASTIADYCSPETDAWIGKQVVLMSAMVDFGGRTVEGIRVRKPKPQAAKPTSKAATSMKAQAPLDHDPRDDVDGDEVPY